MDIKNLILNQLPEGAIEDIARKAGVDKDIADKVISGGSKEILKHGQETEGSLFENLEQDVLSKGISAKTGLDEGIISKVLTVGIPMISKYIDGDELMKIIGGLSNGFGMDDIQNIAGAIINDDEKDLNNSQEKSGGFLGNILGGLFGKK